MSDNLVKRLRKADEYEPLGHDGWEAAARIEELEAELLETQDRANAFATKEYYTEIRAERAEAKLAKAVELLTLCRDMFDEVAHPSDPLSVMLNEILAELTGGKE